MAKRKYDAISGEPDVSYKCSSTALTLVFQSDSRDSTLESVSSSLPILDTSNTSTFDSFGRPAKFLHSSLTPQSQKSGEQNEDHQGSNICNNSERSAITETDSSQKSCDSTMTLSSSATFTSTSNISNYDISMMPSSTSSTLSLTQFIETTLGYIDETNPPSGMNFF